MLADVFAREGIEVRTGVAPVAVAHDGAFTVTLADGSAVAGERLLVATGRRVDLAALGAGSIGVDTTARTFATDAALPRAGREGALPATYALGDMTGQGAFTHVAVHQGRVDPGPAARP